MTRTAGALLAGILLAALTGCVPAADAAAPTSEPPSPTPSVEPPPSIAAKPAVAFDGDCTAIIDDATLSDLVGGDVTAFTGQQNERVWAVAVLGGLECTWGSAASDPYVSLSVMPAAGLEAQVAEADPDSPYCYGNRCSFSTVVGGYWLSGIVGMADAADTALDAIDAIVALVADAAAAAAPVPAARPAGMWSAANDCAALAWGVDTTSILGEPFGAEPGGFGGEAAPGLYGSLRAVGDLPCVWSTPEYGRFFSSELMPGAGWAITELAARAGAEPVVVDGALQAIALPVDGGATAVYATDGVNLAWVTVPADIDRASSSALVAAFMAAASR
ncbi:hypothetical protein [Agromyces mariniharenae]|uniref:DUF3558 domain-containing protein n=1 Tax=Agromyces mariniharenae TaxID=2604423 RepID=A0A5S4V3F3_9MICO|nr:hypothetical protein [Agromyces mariniharenae]TYL52373.1 hypothetical protein FYC51_00955 [Agromyces mariniharenae]